VSARRTSSITRAERKEALHHISELSGWLWSHPLTPQHAQQRADRVLELERWQAYLANLDRPRRTS